MKTHWMTLMLFAALILAACSKTKDEGSAPETPQQVDAREAFVGDYRMSVKGDVNVTLSVPLMSINRDGTYPVDYNNIALRIDKMSGNADSVVVKVTVEGQQQETHGEVIGNKMLLQPTKIKMPLSDLIDHADLGLSETVKETLRPFATGELEIRLYHSPATLADSVMTLTTDMEAEVQNAYFSLEMSGTLNDKGIKN